MLHLELELGFLKNGSIAGFSDSVAYPGCPRRFTVYDGYSLDIRLKTDKDYVAWHELLDGKILLIHESGDIGILDSRTHTLLEKKGILPRYTEPMSMPEKILQVSANEIVVHYKIPHASGRRNAKALMIPIVFGGKDLG